MTPETLKTALHARLPDIEVYAVEIFKMPESPKGPEQTGIRCMARREGKLKYAVCAVSADMNEKEIEAWADDAALIIKLSFQEPTDATRSATINRALSNGGDSQPG